MAGPERIEWRRGFPAGPLALLGWYVLAAVGGLGLVWLLFGAEPQRLDSGRVNPLAVLPDLAVVLVLFGAVPFTVLVLRRPMVAANYYALTVRPGPWRTLVLPWARVARVGAYRVGGEPYLLVRCVAAGDPWADRAGRLDRPGWLDRTVLREAGRRARTGDAPVGGFDVAVRMGEFAGRSTALVATLAAFAPDHVAVADDLSD
jgi:hypothetical protein